MAATNRDPFLYSKSKDGNPDVTLGKVQAGSDQEIKIGEICAYNKTSGYFEPVSAVNDFIYALAIAKQEQKSGDAIRYIEFYTLSPEDVFEFEIASARSLGVGDRFILTASNSQKLTYSATGFPVARQFSHGTIPTSGTTVPSSGYASVTFNPACTYWGLIKTGVAWGTEKFVTSASALTLYPEMSGLTIFNTGAEAASIHTLPQSTPAGTKFKAVAFVAQDHGFAPGAAGGVYVEGAKQTDDKDVTVDAIGDTLEVIADGNGDWAGVATITSAADATGAIDIEA